jgi:hypothetical protein
MIRDGCSQDRSCHSLADVLSNGPADAAYAAVSCLSHADHCEAACAQAAAVLVQRTEQTIARIADVFGDLARRCVGLVAANASTRGAPLTNPTIQRASSMTSSQLARTKSSLVWPACSSRPASAWSALAGAWSNLVSARAGRPGRSWSMGWEVWVWGGGSRTGLERRYDCL